MRATLNFEVDVGQVEGTMAVVACSEEHNLRAAADILSNYTVLDGSLLDSITEVLRLLDSSAVQLRQYQNMMVGFEKARFETMVPQKVRTNITEQADLSIATAKQAVEKLKRFEGFLDKVKKPESKERADDNPES